MQEKEVLCHISDVLYCKKHVGWEPLQHVISVCGILSDSFDE